MRFLLALLIAPCFIACSSGAKIQTKAAVTVERAEPEVVVPLATITVVSPTLKVAEVSVADSSTTETPDPCIKEVGSVAQKAILLGNEFEVICLRSTGDIYATIFVNSLDEYRMVKQHIEGTLPYLVTALSRRCSIFWSSPAKDISFVDSVSAGCAPGK